MRYPISSIEAPLGSKPLNDPTFDAKSKIKRGIPLGYTELATYFIAKNKLRKATLVLQKGLKYFPRNSSFWLQLGNVLSDLSFFEAAYDAYKNALTCSNKNVDIPLIQLNQMVLFWRMGDYKEALLIGELIDDPRYELELLTITLGILHDKKEYKAALEKANLSFFKYYTSSPVSSQNISDELGRIYFYVAHSIYKVYNNKNISLKYLNKSLSYNRGDIFAWWLKRKLQPMELDINTSNYYSISVKGIVQGVDFNKQYEVVAPSLDKTLYIITEQDHISMNIENLEIKKFNIYANPSGNVAGIYKST